MRIARPLDPKNLLSLEASPTTADPGMLHTLIESAELLAGVRPDDANEIFRRVLSGVGTTWGGSEIAIVRRDTNYLEIPYSWLAAAPGSADEPALGGLLQALGKTLSNDTLWRSTRKINTGGKTWTLQPIRTCRAKDTNGEELVWGALCIAGTPLSRRLDAIAPIATLMGAALMRLDDESRLRKSFEIHRRQAEVFFELAPVGIGMVDDANRFVRVNPALARFGGRSNNDHVGKHIEDVFAAPVASEVLEHLAAARLQQKGLLRRTMIGRDADGSLKRVAATFFPIHLEECQELGVAAFVTEMSDRHAYFARALKKVAEASEAKSDEEFWGALAREVAKIAGARFASICERDPADPSQMRTLALWDGDGLRPNVSFPIDDTPCQIALSKGAAHYPRKLRSHFPDEPWFRQMEVEAYHGLGLFDATGDAIGAIQVMHDAVLEDDHLMPILSVFAARALAELVHRRAERRSDELDAAMRQGQRLQAMGQLAGGVAHDFNNLLTVVTGNSEIALEDLERHRDPQGVARAVGEIRSAADRAARLTRQLLAFSRRQVLRPQILNVATILADMQQMLRRLIGEDIDLRISSARTVRNVHADPGQIEQVILNLVLNARDAMPTGGVLTIEIGEREVDRERRSLQPDAPDGPCVRIAVRDTGSGMKREIADRAFEPFFTTKAVGEGSGLGLATVHGVVSQSGGSVFLDTNFGVGTRVEVFLPIANGGASQATPTEKTPLRKRRGTVLLCEDETSVRHVIQRHLQRVGYRVLLASDPREALTRLESKGAIDLLLSDVVMPGMRGPELLAAARKLRPELPVLFISGYPLSRVDKRIRDPSAAFLPKPFRRHQLLNAVAGLLEPRE